MNIKKKKKVLNPLIKERIMDVFKGLKVMKSTNSIEKLIINNLINMKTNRIINTIGILILIVTLSSCDKDDSGDIVPIPPGSGDLNLPPLNPQLVAEGKDIFRYDTFGDETFWTDVLQMNQVIETAVSPATALAVGLKVDASALPDDVVEAIQNRSEERRVGKECRYRWWPDH